MLFRIIVLFSCFFCLFFSDVYSKEVLPPAFQQAKLDEKLGSSIDTSVLLYNSKGESFVFSDLLDSRPIILNFVYYSCPQLCHFIADGIVRGVNGLDVNLIEKFKIITVSFDDRDTSLSMSGFKDKYLGKVDDRFSSLDWEFYRASKDDIVALTQSVGFNFYFNEKSQEYAHPSVVTVLTPEAKISRYLFGIIFRPFDLKLSVLEASKRKFVSAIDSVVLFCYNYDPDERGYVFEAFMLMRVSAGLSVMLLAFLIFRLNRIKKINR